MCPNYEPEGQGRGSTFRVCHALKKIAILLNKSLIPSHLKWPALYITFFYLKGLKSYQPPKFTFYTTFFSKSDFWFVLLPITFEPLEVEQSYIPLLKALMCGINAVGAQGSGCMFTMCHAPLKMAVLLHKTEKVWDSFSETVCICHY